MITTLLKAAQAFLLCWTGIVWVLYVALRVLWCCVVTIDREQSHGELSGPAVGLQRPLLWVAVTLSIVSLMTFAPRLLHLRQQPAD